MIYHLNGRLVEKNPAYVVIECGGIGYQAHISLQTFSAIGSDENVKLFTHFVVREDAHSLFGFATIQEREMFQKLISVSGVGANTARVMLSALSSVELAQAILQEDVNVLKAIKGIGAKSAQRIIVDLKDKIDGVAISDNPGDFNTSVNNTAKAEALSALLALGFDKKIAEKAVDKSLMGVDKNLGVEALVKLALKSL